MTNKILKITFIADLYIDEDIQTKVAVKAETDAVELYIHEHLTKLKDNICNATIINNIEIA